MSERLGKYELLEQVAEGGMAKVYRAKTVELGGVEKIVAVKRVRDELSNDQEFIEMLVDEARISVRMTHKNICQVYGIENVDNSYFIVMELVEGGDLTGLLRWFQQTGRVLPVEVAVYIAIEICSGLSYAHRMTSIDGVPLGLIHRDVTPQNVLISREGEVKLIDFGIAKADVSSQKTQAGVIKGKFNYMSPEQARGEHIDQRTDVFALGAVLYEMVTGQMLYPLSLDDEQLHRNIKMANYVPVDKVRNDIPAELKKIIEKALTRDMQQRFASSRDFLLALTSFFHNYGKQFDTLSMQMLVERYLEARADKNKPTPKEDASPKKDSLADVTDADTDSLDLNEDEVGYRDDGPTSVYNKNDILGLMNGSASFSDMQPIRRDLTDVNRCVDLEVNKEQYSGKTEVVALNSVKDRAKPNLPPISPRLKVFILVGIFLFVLIGVVVIIINNLVEHEESQIRLTVDSVPKGAAIWMDGADSGLKTPTSEVKQNHRIYLKMPLYKDYLLEPKKGEIYFSVEMVPEEAVINVNTAPDYASVYLDADFRCKTPCEFRVKKTEKYNMVIKKSGYQTKETLLMWEDDDSTKDNLTFKYTLQPN